MTRLGLLCDRVVEAGWLAALVTVPLYFNIYSSRVFEPDKLTLLRAIVLVMCVAYVVKVLEARRGEIVNEMPSEESTRSRTATMRSRNPLALPALVLAAIHILASIFSISPANSFWGSYQRLQGTYTLLTYIALFFIIAHNLRSKAQVDRFVKVALLTSIPISLYGVAQNQHLDPLPWGGDVTFRVTSSMGNAIFLAAYLIMVVPLTMARLVEVIWRLRNWKGTSSWAWDWRLAGLVGLLVLQNTFLALFVKSSVGSPNLWWGALPAIGVFLASAVAFVSPPKSYLVLAVEGIGYCLLLSLQLVAIFLTQSRGPWIGLGIGIIVFVVLLSVFQGSRRAMLISSSVALLLAALVILFNVPNTPLAPLKSVPYIGRMGQLLETESGTGKVRVLIWQGALGLVMGHPSIGFSEDRFNALRPMIGYGPETMYVAFNKVYPPDLAHYEARNATPDRSHMDILDHLVTTGVLGAVAFLAVLYVSVASAWRALKQARTVTTQLLFIGVISAITAHFFESQVGIAIASTLTYLWAFLGLSVAVRHLAGGNDALVQSGATVEEVRAVLSQAAAVPRVDNVGARTRNAKKSRTGGSVHKRTVDRAVALDDAVKLTVLGAYVLATTVGIVFLSTSPANLDIWLTFVLSFAWLVVGIVVVGLSFGALPRGATWRPGNLWLYAPLGAAAIVAISANLNGVIADIQFKRGFGLDAQRQWEQAIPAYQAALNLAPGQDFYYLFMGRAFLELAKTNQRPRVNPPLTATSNLVRRISLQDVARLGKQDMLELSRAALEEALVLNPLNTDHHANLARLYRYWGEVDDRQKLDLSLKYYAQATTLSPQAAHLWAEWAEVYLAKGLAADAIEKASIGARLDPVYPTNFVYLGDAYLAEGKAQDAIEAHARALELDPLALSDPRLENRTSAYIQAGIADRLTELYRKAADSERGRNVPALHSAYGYVLSKQGKVSEALQEFQEWARLAPKDWLAHRNLAISYQALGMIDASIAEAAEARKLAPPDQQQALQNWIDDLEMRKK